MIDIVSNSDGEQFSQKLERIRSRSVSFDEGLMQQVAAIIEDVRRRGDAALIEYTAHFDGCRITPSDLRITSEALHELAAKVSPLVRKALREAILRVRRFHEFERETSWEMEAPNNVHLGQRISPIGSAGLYVPGGSASYPSSVVMNVVPAQVAGVERIAVTTPPLALRDTPAVAAALVELGISEVYAVGGAQAIAALAYGTETIPRVDKITGPGNRFVAAAKKLVFGVVGIDSIAGPTEVVIVADQAATAAFVAADMLAQAEHAIDASSILITNSQQLAANVAHEIESQVSTLPRREIIEESLSQFGAIIVVNNMIEACDLVNELAPEHVEIMGEQQDELARQIHNAGAIFLGDHSPEAVGDYLAGPNHVLPTSRTARFMSALGVYDFIKRTSMVRFSASELRNTAQLVAELARAEGLEAHAQSVLIRNEKG